MKIEKKFRFVVTNEDYVVRDHQLYEKRMMPGVVFLDIVFRYVKSKSYDVSKLELKNVIFKEPIVTSEYLDRKVQVSIQEKDGYYLLNARSIEWKDGKILGTEWHDNFEAELHESIDDGGRKIDPESLKKNAYDIKDMDTCYDFCRKVGLVHYEFMKLLGEVYIAQDYILAKVWLGELAESTRASFYLHPAYLDGSLSVPGSIGLDQEEIDTSSRRPYIPMFIGSFKAKKQLPQTCYVYIDKKNVREREIALTQKRDINYYDVEIFNEQGERLVFYEKFGVKMVRNRETIEKLAMEKEPKDIEKPSNEKLLSDSGKSITDIILEIVSRMINCRPEEIEQNLDYYDLGLDSKDLLNMVKMIEENIGQKLYPTLLFEYSTIKQLSEYLEKKFGGQKKAVLDTIVEEKEDIAEDVYYAPYWLKGELEDLQVNNTDEEKTFLLYHSEDDFGEWMKNQFTKQQFYSVVYSEDDEILQSGSLERKFQECGQPDSIYFIAKNADNGTRIDDVVEMKKAEERGILAFFFLIKQLILGKWIRNVKKMVVITDNNLQIENEEQPLPFSHALFGFLRTFAMEYPQIEVIAVDVNKNDLMTTNQLYNNKKFNQLQALKATFPFHEYALRKNILYEKRIAPLENFRKGASKFREKGVYLIVGGANGIGLEVCKYLVNTYKAKVIITGRSALTEHKKILEDLRENVYYFQADVTNKEEMNRVRQQVNTLFGNINGIIHSAVNMQDSVIGMMTPDALRKVLQPKCLGAVILYEVFASENPDFFLFFSSTQSLFSSYGQGNYTAACSFEDGYAETLSVVSPSCVKVINWGYWGSVGIAARNKDNRDNLERGGAISIEPREGMHYIETVLSGDSNHVIVVKAKEQVLVGSGVDLDRRILKSNCVLEKNEEEIENEKRNYEVQKVFNADDLIGRIEVNSKVSVESINSEKIRVLGMGTIENLEHFSDFWRNLKGGEFIPIGEQNIVEEYLKGSSKKDKIVHLLVDTEETGKMEVITAGEGPTILFLNGFGLTASQWYYQFCEWMSDYQLIVAHIPGVGLSEGKNQDVSIRTIAEQYINLFELLHVQNKVYIITSSWGGLVGQMIAAKYPQKTNALIMSGGFAKFSSKEIRFREVIKRDFENIHAMERYELIRKSEYLNPISMSYSDEFSTEDIIKEIQVPVMIIYGEQDMVVKKELTDQLIEALPKAKVVVINDAGHVPNVTHSELFNNEVTKFMNQIK